MDSLQSSMLGALEHDQRKQQVNDAKMRAVKQHVEYDDFEKLVAGAHLKPVKPKSAELASISKPFDFFVMPAYDATAAAAPSASAAAAAAAAAVAAAAPAAAARFAPPSTGQEFLRAWRRQCKTAADRFEYLRVIEPEELPSLFRAELDAAVFDQIVDAVRATALAAPPLAHAGWVARLLRAIGQVNRFDLTLDLADAKALAALGEIFDALQAPPADADAAAAAATAEEEARPDAAAVAALRAQYKL